MASLHGLMGAVRPLAISTTLLMLAACGGHGDEGSEKPSLSAQTVTTTSVQQVALPRIITASGTVSAWEDVPVAAETGGLTATAVLVDEGAYVRQGQVLVRMNDALLQAQLRQQQASLQSAEAQAALKDSQLARAQELMSRGFLSQASLDMSLAEQRAAAAQLAAARAALAETRTRLDQAVLRAPVAGLISSRSVTRGQIVNAGEEMFRIVRDGRLELDAQVPESELGLVRSGMTATITSDHGGETNGSIRIVTPQVDTQTRLGLARISLASGGGLRPGMFARAQINAGEQPSTVVPNASVLYRENRAGVYILQTDNRVRFQPVSVLTRREDTTAVSGLTVGQQVIVDGAGFLGDGDHVSVVKPGQVAAPASPAAASPKK